MKRLMLSALHSGAGKTVTTCALLAALKRRGVDVRAFKSGPDYIDPMFHTRVLGVPSRNLDLFLQGADGVRRTLARQRGEFAVLEGAMGFYDGVAGTERASAWELAVETETPVVLVLRPNGSGITLAAQVKGVTDFRPHSHVAGLLLADCGEPLAAYLTPILERETSLPVLGFLPPMKAARLESRHLGLLTAAEVADAVERFGEIAEQLEKTVDLDALLALAAAGEDPPEPASAAEKPRCRIAVARDEAFCFYYEDNLDALRAAGAKLVPFSPLWDRELPEEIDGLYLGGGYPELYAGRLSENAGMIRAVGDAVRGGMPTVAECGGFLYLQRSLEDERGLPFPMCGVFPGKAFRTERLRRFGYQYLTAEEDSLLLRKGERLPAHEFHYWDCTENGTDLCVIKPGGAEWRCGFVSETLYAAFPHLHFGGELPLAERFAAACAKRGNEWNLSGYSKR